MTLSSYNQVNKGLSKLFRFFKIRSIFLGKSLPLLPKFFSVWYNSLPFVFCEYCPFSNTQIYIAEFENGKHNMTPSCTQEYAVPEKNKYNSNLNSVQEKDSGGATMDKNIALRAPSPLKTFIPITMPAL